jgi:hypothetical protein
MNARRAVVEHTAEAETPKLDAGGGLSDLQRLSLEWPLFSGDVGVVFREVEQLATLLSSSSRGSSTARELVSQHVATAHVQVAALSALLGKVVAKKDVDGSRAVSRLLNDAARRLATLIQAYSDVIARARPSVILGQAARVNVGEGAS